MKILVVSDSHGFEDKLCRIVRQQTKADVVLFLGDGEDDFDSVKAKFSDKMFIGVRGNNDWCSRLSNTEVLSFCGVKIFMAHGHTYNVKYGLERIKAEGRRLGADVVLYGHTHISNIEYEDGLYVMNPGAVMNYPGEYGVIDIQNGDVLLNTARFTERN